MPKQAEAAADKAVRRTGVPVRRPALDYETNPQRESPLLGLVKSSLPGLDVLQRYDRCWLRPDVFAGVAVAAYLVPQVMAYTAIINVPPVTGLWDGVGRPARLRLPRRLAGAQPGPGVNCRADGRHGDRPAGRELPERAIALTAALSLIVAGWLLIARVFRLGVVSDLLSQPLLVGYLAGGAVLMIVGQLGKMTGTSVDGDSIVEQVRSFLSVVGQTHLTTLLVGLGTLALLLLIVWRRLRWPGPLIAVATATAVCAITHLDRLWGRRRRHGPDRTAHAAPARGVGCRRQGPPCRRAGVAIVAYGDITLIARGFPSPPDGRTAPEVDPQQGSRLSGVHAATGLVGVSPVSACPDRPGHRRCAAVPPVLAGRLGLHRHRPLRRGPVDLDAPQGLARGGRLLCGGEALVAGRDIIRLRRFRPPLWLAVARDARHRPARWHPRRVAIAIALSLRWRCSSGSPARRGSRPGAGFGRRRRPPDALTLPGLVVHRYDAPLFFANVS